MKKENLKMVIEWLKYIAEWVVYLVTVVWEWVTYGFECVVEFIVERIVRSKVNLPKFNIDFGFERETDDGAAIGFGLMFILYSALAILAWTRVSQAPNVIAEFAAIITACSISLTATMFATAAMFCKE